MTQLHAVSGNYAALTMAKFIVGPKHWHWYSPVHHSKYK